MFVHITDDRSGEVLLSRELGPNEMLECDIYARELADLDGFRVAPKTGHVPNGCADFTVTLQDEPGSVICWTSESYFADSEDAA